MVRRTVATVHRWFRSSLDQLTTGQQWTIVSILGLLVALLGAGAPEQGSASTAEVASPAAIAPRSIDGAPSATLPPVPVVAPAPAFGEPVADTSVTQTTTTTAPPPPSTTTTTEPPPPAGPDEPSPLPFPLPLP